jgi:molecular chaperone GrpE
MANSPKHRPNRHRYTIGRTPRAPEEHSSAPARVGTSHVPTRALPPEEARSEARPQTEASADVAELATDVRERAAGTSNEEEWRDRALRLQAEMENYRKRQQRFAQEQVKGEQERLLREILAIADNLDRTLSAAEKDTPIRRGVALTREQLLRLLKRYEVELVEALHKPFDPAWHEAVDVVSSAELGVRPGSVVQVVEPGYRRGERLLRPARVIVAQ